jgi:[ribosomal protein S18]-alanine N-acetyltransferase
MTIMALRECTIRRMEIRDLEDVHAIETTSSLTPWSKRMFMEEMSHPYAFCFVVTSKEPSDPRVVGFICFRNIGEESELLNICVHPDHRHVGFGRELMEFYTAFSLQRGMKTFHLEVNRANPSAVRLYHSFCYQPVGVRPKFYRGEFDALRMMKRV